MRMPLHVIIVEDSEDDAALLLRQLRKGGYAPVWERVDIEEDLNRVLDQGAWELILSDYAMPHFSAQAALQVVKKRGLDIPFLIVSGAIGEDAAVAMMKAGAHDFIKKDNLTRLNAAIERELRETSERRKRREAEQQLQQYEGELRSLASELSLAEERQRRLLATDLHDGIGQYLVLIQIKMGELRKLAADPALTGPVDEIRKLLDVAIHDTRNLTSQLSPPILYDLGLEAALKWLCEQFRKQQNISFRVQAEDGLETLDLDIKVLIFQSVRELIRNIVRHAKAQCCQIALGLDGGRFVVSVSDNGAGFDPTRMGSHMYKNGSFGLFSIRERLRSLGGELTIESWPGGGTRVTMVIPHKSAASSAFPNTA